MTLTKAELADLLFEQLGLNKREARTWSSFFFGKSACLESGDSVNCPLWTSTPENRSDRANPKTGEEIPSRGRVVTFIESKLKACRSCEQGRARHKASYCRRSPPNLLHQRRVSDLCAVSRTAPTWSRIHAAKPVKRRATAYYHP